MSETNLTQLMIAHEPAFVYMAIHTVDVPLGCILPHRNVTAVLQDRLTNSVLGYHYFILAKLVLEIAVIEVCASINKRFLLVSALHKLKELEHRVTEFLYRKTAACLNVDHGYEILVLRPALGHEVAQLGLLRDTGTVKVIRTDLQTMLMGQLDIALVFAVNIVTTLGSLKIDISHPGIIPDSLPEHISLIMAHVYAMDMCATVLTLGLRHNGADRKY